LACITGRVLANSLRSAKTLTKNLWMGSTGIVTGLHYDTEDNINVQVRGRKEIILFPSAQLHELYPPSVWDYMSNFSRIDIATPDLLRYPRFSRATPLRAVLEPGDFIFIPIYWWHYFNTLEASLNVNFWWLATPAKHYEDTAWVFGRAWRGMAISTTIFCNKSVRPGNRCWDAELKLAVEPQEVVLGQVSAVEKRCYCPL
jgi:Cupin-like domain